MLKIIIFSKYLLTFTQLMFILCTIIVIVFILINVCLFNATILLYVFKIIKLNYLSFEL